MARYRKIDPRIWNDAKFSRLSNEAKLLFIYLLTSPQTQMIGAVPMRAESVAAELGYDAKRYGIRYRELYDMGIVEYDERGLFWVKNYLKYNSPDNSKVVISWRDCLDFLPECPLLRKIIESARAHCLSRGEQYAAAFEKGIGNSMAYGMAYGIENGTEYSTPYKELELEQELNKDKKKIEKEKAKKKDVEKPEEVSEETWQDFLVLRNKLKAPLTQTALNVIRKEAEKAGISLEDALKTCCMRGWRGFKADWIRPKNGTGYVRQTTTPAQEDFMRDDYWANEPEEMIP